VDDVEGDETATVNLIAGASYQLFDPNQSATATIHDGNGR